MVAHEAVVYVPDELHPLWEVPLGLAACGVETQHAAAGALGAA
jgi:hypothetical protein